MRLALTLTATLGLQASAVKFFALSKAFVHRHVDALLFIVRSHLELLVVASLPVVAVEPLIAVEQTVDYLAEGQRRG